jgi:hypothetical protein
MRVAVASVVSIVDSFRFRDSNAVRSIATATATRDTRRRRRRTDARRRR